MSLAPGYQITVGDRGPGSPDPGDVSSWFVVTLSERGPVGRATESRSFSQWKATYGDKVAWSDTYRAVEAFFREGGARVVASRVVGPAPTKGELALRNTSPADVVKVYAASPGDYSTGLKITVTAGVGNERLVTLKDGGELLWSARSFSSKEDLAAALNVS